ncbi:MAG TPA: polysaccharide deacetylase family protein [Balneolales bacterium]|nr:polysaccharide deacetylase family protein [Balneolales bacterium]
MINTAVSHNIKVLVYHRIVDDEELAQKNWMCVHVDQFYKHLKWIEQMGYTSITLEDYWLYMMGELQLPRKPIIITFDDGYEEIYKLARPVLQEFGMRVVLFVLGNRNLHENEWDKKLGLPAAPLLKDRQIVELYDDGFEIGAHTLNHVHLPNLSPVNAWKEIYDSKKNLESLIKGRVYSFSYPYGAITKDIQDMVAQIGFFFGCSVFTGPPQFGRDPLQIRRLTIAGNYMGLALRLMTPYEYAEWIWWRFRSSLQSGASGDDLHHIREDPGVHV